jgi:hypothetical protein
MLSQEVKMSNQELIKFFMGFAAVLIVVGIILYIYMAICLQTIAKKTSTPYGWLAWIPIANIFLMAMVAKKPWWWALIIVLADVIASFFMSGQFAWLAGILSIIVLVFFILIWVGICQARNKPAWWTILLLIPVVNLVMLGILAFSD